MQKRVIAFVLALCMLISVLPAFAVGKDVYGHWAESDITYLDRMKIMEGYPDGTFLPNNQIKKSEFITLVNRTFGLTRTASIDYPDVSASKWFYSQIQKAKAAGYMFVFSGNVRPEQNLTRQEASAMFGKLLGLSSTAASKFSDASSIGSWALPFVNAVAEAGIINGYPDGTFKPNNPISRAEVAHVICNIIGNYYNTAGTYSDYATGNVTVVSNGVTLRNMTIPGDLYITEGVGYGTVTLDNVVVGGKIITIGMPNVTLILKGDNTQVELGSGIATQVAAPIKALTVSSAGTATISVAKDASVETLTLNSAANIVGSGSVLTAKINAMGTTLEMRPKQWVLAVGIGATIAGTYTTTSGTGASEGFAENYPKAKLLTSALGTATIEVTAKTTKVANLYCAAVPYGSTQPTAQQIKAPQLYGASAIVKSNYTYVYDLNNEVVVTLAGLSAGQNYEVWMVLEDAMTGALGTPVKVSPEVSVFAEAPVILSTTTNSATLSVKLNKAATVYWTAVPKTSTAIPTAQQVVSQTALLNAVRGSARVNANIADTITVTGLTLGASAYDIYLATKDSAGTIAPEVPEKISISEKNNSMTVSYSTSADTDGEYPANTYITLTFAKEMFRGGEPLSFLFQNASKINSCLTIKRKNVVTGEETVVTDYVLNQSSHIANGNREFSIAPPIGGWASASVYTIEISGLVSSDGAEPTPAKIEFKTDGAASVVAAPVASKVGSVYPGEVITLTCATPNSKIRYSTASGWKEGNGTGVTIQIPQDAVAAQLITLQAQAYVGNRVSELITFSFTVSTDYVVPRLETYDGVSIPNGVSIPVGTYVYLTSNDPDNTTTYYEYGDNAAIGTPTFNHSRYASGANRAAILVQSNTGKFYIKAYALKTSGQSSSYGANATFELTVETPTNYNKPAKPYFSYNGVYQAASSTSPLPVSSSQSLQLASFNIGSTTCIYYTVGQWSDPTAATSNRVQLGATGTIALGGLSRGSNVIRAAVYNYATGQYSETVTLNIVVQ